MSAVVAPQPAPPPQAVMVPVAVPVAAPLFTPPVIAAIVVIAAVAYRFFNSRKDEQKTELEIQRLDREFHDTEPGSVFWGEP